MLKHAKVSALRNLEPLCSVASRSLIYCLDALNGHAHNPSLRIPLRLILHKLGKEREEGGGRGGTSLSPNFSLFVSLGQL